MFEAFYSIKLKYTGVIFDYFKFIANTTAVPKLALNEIFLYFNYFITLYCCLRFGLKHNLISKRAKSHTAVYGCKLFLYCDII